jgi:serine phosphatase RsbU (regulator of sigma subunit)
MMQETAPSGASIASYGRSCRGERYSGDLAFIQEHRSELFLAIVDAVGHGRSAYGVAMEVKSILRSENSDDLLALIQILHQRLKGGPGAVMIAGKLDSESRVFTFVQIGDSHGKIFGPRRRSLVGVAGMLGHAIRTPRVRIETLSADDTLVLCTDGVSERYDLDEIQGYQTMPTEALARRIVEQFGKDHDDATCLVVRCD